MTPEEFRKQGYALVDWITDYLEGIERHPVSPRVEPGWVRAQLPQHPPSEPEAFDQVLADLDRVIVPGLTHWQHPSFFAYFPANTSYPAILGELAAAGLGVNGMLWATSPACTELETLMMDWMVELLGLPDRFRSSGAGGGVIQGSASEATLCAILAARERATGGAGNRHGAPGNLVAYATSQAHSSIEKGLRIAGIGSDNLRVVAHDAAMAMRPDALAAAIAEDKAAGRRPFFVCATAGTTSTTAFDPVAAIATICRGGGPVAPPGRGHERHRGAVPSMRWVNAGLDRVDSYCTNPHKWMGVNFDCDLFWVADRTALLDALSILPEYLRSGGRRSGRRHRLPRLADPARAAVPVAQAVVHVARRRRRPSQDMIRDHVPGRRTWPAGWRRTIGSIWWRPIRSTWSAPRCGPETTPPTPSSRPRTLPGRRCSHASAIDGRSIVRFCVGRTDDRAPACASRVGTASVVGERLDVDHRRQAVARAWRRHRPAR